MDTYSVKMWSESWAADFLGQLPVKNNYKRYTLTEIWLNVALYVIYQKYQSYRVQLNWVRRISVILVMDHPLNLLFENAKVNVIQCQQRREIHMLSKGNITIDIIIYMSYSEY